MAEPIISVSGLRGSRGRDPHAGGGHSLRGGLCRHRLRPGRIVVGRDSRPSGRMLAAGDPGGLAGRGPRHASTPASSPRRPPACWSAQVKAAGGIQITASHNPSPYNGLKLFSAEGRVIPAGPGEKVLRPLSRRPARLGAARPARRAAGRAPTPLSAHLAGRAGHGRRRADPRPAVPRAARLEPRGRQRRWAGGCWRNSAAT